MHTNSICIRAENAEKPREQIGFDYNACPPDGRA
jgi:hypothetical protein